MSLACALLAAVSSVLPALLLLLAARQLWEFRWSITRDAACTLPLPRGSMGWPLIGETFHWLLQVRGKPSNFLQKHGTVFKTHLLGKPVIRVTGAENIRKILLGEHTVVSTQWPQSTRIILGPHALINSVGDLHKKKRKILARVFSRGALETYLTRLQEIVKSETAKWCAELGSVDVYTATKSLTFRIAVRVLLGLHLEEPRIRYLSKIFEQLMSNLFSLPVDAPLSGLRKGKRARDILHSTMERIIEEKLAKQHSDEYCDAFDYMLSGAKESDYSLSMQELKEIAVELIFAAHSTTASASTSLILQLMRHPDVAERTRAELEAEGLVLDACGACLRCKEGNYVVKEMLRYLPPVSGGYRTVLQTFELNGYQIPKGWSVMYSIRDTHETAAAYQKPELFDPERFSAERDESKNSRFSYVPFGGGVRMCIGREFAVIVLKTLCVELLATVEWSLATETYPRMQTVPIVHPVNGGFCSYLTC
uniref:Cytochrome P450, family 26, subfamily C, polypeptide 1 n=1 Tax=Electrophorus electricus TaxID=8005 RepID=A0A4W4H7R0_ELEEL